MTVLRFLTPKRQTCYLNTNSTVRQAIEKFNYYGLSVIPIIDEHGRYVATVSESDVMKYLKKNRQTDLNSANKINILSVIKSDSYIACGLYVNESIVAELLIRQSFVPIIDDRGVFCGVVQRRTLLEAFAYNNRAQLEFKKL